MPRIRIPFICLPVAVIALLMIGGCGGEDEKAVSPLQTAAVVTLDNAESKKGDLDAIRKRGEFGILAQRSGENYLPRRGDPLRGQTDLAIECGRSLDLEPVLVVVDDFDQLIPALLAGKGDIIAANLTVTEARQQHLAFSRPLAHAREQIVARAGEEKIRERSGLSGRTVAVQEGTSFLETLRGLQKEIPGLKIRIIPGDLSSDDILDRVASGDVDLAVEDSNVLAVALSYRSDVRPVLDLTGQREIAWGLRPDNPELLQAVNRFLEGAARTGSGGEVYRADLPGIRGRGVLRMLTVNNATTYFLLWGELMGFEYELVRYFAESLNMKLEVVVAPAYDDLIPWLREGRGDLIAAFMTAGKDREERGIRFSRPYHYAEEIVVARAEERALKTPRDLDGRTVVVRPGSSYRKSLEELKRSGVNLSIGNAPPEMETEEIIDNVARGEFDLTAADTQILDLETSYRDDIKGVFSISGEVPHGWAVREEDHELLAAVNTFIEKEYRGVFYNITYKKYFKNPRKVKQAAEEYGAVMKDGKISPYDDLTRRYADRYGFFWRLIVAQIYQESRFNPRARAWSGARGLMQVMPKTAKEFGFTDLENPEIGLHAGIRYMDWVRGQLAKTADLLNRAWFTLAGYNAGVGHLQDARRLARQMNWNPDAWFDNVEKAMLLLSRPEYARKARYGYVRGREPVSYVSAIRDRYRAYQSLAGESFPETAAADPAGIPASPPPLPAATEPPSRESALPQPAEKEKAPSGKTFTVRKGDTLSKIAGEVYGDRGAWQVIYRANRDILPGPDALKVGQELKIPDRQ
ncbi:MAG: transporter substrate-binding domain-containing protein [PVC group bacterium]